MVSRKPRPVVSLDLLRFGGGFKRRLCSGAVGGLMAFAAVTAGGTSSASAAGAVNYCGQALTNPGTWCIHAQRHSYYHNSAIYYGSGTIFVCQKVILDSNGADYFQSCGQTSAVGDWTAGPLLKPLVYNGDNNRHTIQGHAAW